MADRYWVGGTGTWNTSTTTNWSATSGGAGGASAPTSADNVFFNSASNATAYTVTVSVSATCADMTMVGPASGNVTWAGTGTLNIAGSVNVASTGVTRTYTGAITLSATTTGKTVTIGPSLTSAITFNGVGGAWTLGGALTTTGTVTFTAGSFDTSSVSNYSLTVGRITATSASAVTLSLNASTVSITVTTLQVDGAGLTFNAGTSQINFTATSITTTVITSSGQTFYNVAFTGGASADTTIGGANTFNNFSVTAPSATGIREVIFQADQTINGAMTGSGATEIRRIFYRSDTLGTARTLTLASGPTLSNADFRDITAATSAITATSSGGDCGGNTNITLSTPKTVYWSLAAGGSWSATAWATTSGGSPALANFPLAQDTAIIENTGLNTSATITVNASWSIGTWDMSTRTNAATIARSATAVELRVYSSWLNGTGVTYAGSFFGSAILLGRGNTQQILGNGVTFNFPVSVQNIGGTVQLTDAMTLGTTRTFTLTNGTLDLQSYTLTTGLFSSSNANTRTIAFGTGNITVNGTGTVWTTSTSTNLTTTGTQVVNVSNATATSTTVSSGLLDEANSISFNFTTGTYALTLSGGSKRNLNFTGFAGTVSNSAQVIYGDLTLAAAATYTAGTSIWTFASTSGTPRTITSNGETMDFPLTFNGVGGSWVLQDALTMGSTRTLLHNNGTIDLNGMTLTVGASYTTQVGTKNLTFNGGAMVCPGAFSNNNSAGFTTTAGTGTGEIRMTSATAKTFGGGAAVPGVFNCTLVQAGAGALTITGGPTINDITNTTQPATVLFTSSTTTTFNNFSLSGTAGNLITIASVTSGTQATFYKASGTVTVNYCDIQDINATGGATWTAITVANGGTNIDNGNNLGWVFAAGSNVNVNVTGVEGVCSVGVGTVVADANAPPTGVEAVGSVGTVAVKGTATVEVTGVFALGLSRNGIVFAKANVTLTGVSAAGSVGTATVSAKANVTLTGVSAAGSVGTVAVSLPTQVTVTGVEATGAVGTLDATGKAYVTLTGVAASVAIDGVGVATGGSISVDPGDVVGYGEVGTVTFNAGANTTLTGVSASNSVGIATVAAKANTTLTGVSATGSVGTATVAAKATTTLTGVEASGAIGTVTATATISALVNVTGVEATGSVGTLDATGKANVTLTGVSASGAVGTVTTQSSVTVTGVSCTVTLGSVVISAGATVSLTGVQATGYIGPVLVWSVINDNQTPNWQAVDDSQSAGWSAIADGNTVVWTEIPT